MYDVVLLDDGREGAIIELFGENEAALIDFGKDEEFIDCKKIVKITYKHQNTD